MAGTGDVDGCAALDRIVSSERPVPPNQRGDGDHFTTSLAPRSDSAPPTRRRPRPSDGFSAHLSDRGRLARRRSQGVRPSHHRGAHRMRFRTIVTAVVGLLVGASSAQAAVTFTGDFESGDLSQWDLVQACPDDATVYSADSHPDWPAPVEGTHALRLSVAASHVLSGATMNCDSPAGNP